MGKKTSTSGTTPPFLLSRWRSGCTCSAGQQHMEACLGARLSGRNMKRRLRRAQACPSPPCLLLRNITSFGTGADNKICLLAIGEAVCDFRPGFFSRISAVHSAPPPRLSEIFLDLFGGGGLQSWKLQGRGGAMIQRPVAARVFRFLGGFHSEPREYPACGTSKPAVVSRLM